MSTTSIKATPSPRYERLAFPGYGALAFHALVIAFILATQILYTPVRDLGPDNTWHYRLARDIVTGVPIYQAGLDGNRLFPDLIFVIASYVLSGGSLFTEWLPYFYCVFFLAVYVSLLALAPMLYEGVLERRAFVLLSVAGLWVFELAAPFWPRWIFDPGNHGTGLPVAIGCLALAFWMNKHRRFSWLGAAAFVVLASLLVGSNRFLLLAVLLPLLAATVVAIGTRWLSARTPGAPLTWPSFAATTRPLVLVAVMVAIACVGSLITYKVLSTLSWHRSVTYMGVQVVNHQWSLTWGIEKLAKEISDLGMYYVKLTRQVIAGPGLGIASVIGAAVLLARALQGRQLSAVEENRLMFGLFAAASAVLSMAFVIWGWDENGDWRYRYLAMETAFSVIFLAALLVRPSLSIGRPGLLATATVVGLVALTVIPALNNDRQGRADRNQKFHNQVNLITDWLNTQTSVRPLRGLGEYWAVMDVTARTNLRTDLLDEKSRAQFYNTNVGRLCLGGYSFIMRKVEANAPRRNEIVGLLGEPRASKEFELEGHGHVEIMVYDPETIQTKLVEDGKARAKELFPNFRCPG